MRIAWVLFAKPPVSGFVKTRLARVIGDEFATDLYRQILSWQWQNLRQVMNHAASKRAQAFVYTAPPEGMSLRAARRLLRAIPPRTKIKVRLQAPGSLGDKMEACFADLLVRYDYVVIWGADIPLIHEDHLLSAIASREACIAPAVDGGYSLIALGRDQFRPGIMDNIPWSADNTLEKQLQQLASLGIGCELLATIPDMDEIGDIAANIEFMRAHPHAAYAERLPVLEKALAQIEAKQPLRS